MKKLKQMSIYLFIMISLTTIYVSAYSITKTCKAKVSIIYESVDIKIHKYISDLESTLLNIAQ